MQCLSLNSKERIEKPSLHIILEWETVAMSLYLLSLFYYLYSKEKSSILLKKWKRWYFNTVLRNTSWKNCLTIFITALSSKPWNVWLLHFKLWNIRFYPVDKRKIFLKIKWKLHRLLFSQKCIFTYKNGKTLCIASTKTKENDMNRKFYIFNIDFKISITRETIFKKIYFHQITKVLSHLWYKFHLQRQDTEL